MFKDRKTTEDKGKLIFSNYMAPKFNKYRKAMDITTIVLFILFITTVVIVWYYPNECLSTFGLVFFIGFIAMLISRFRFNSEDFRIYEYGIEARFLRKPKSKKAAHLGTSAGVRYFPFDRIEKIYHRTDIGRPIRPEISQYSLGMILVCIEISDSGLCSYLPISAISDILPLLEYHLGDRWDSVYQAPEG